jgi:anti-sigma B factor antagonist
MKLPISFRYAVQGRKGPKMMTTNIHTNGNTVIVHLNGSFDITEVNSFELRFKSLLRQRPKNIALHLKDLLYIDSSGIGSIIRCMNYAMRENSHLVCYDLNDSIRLVFDMTHLAQFVEVLSERDFMSKYTPPMLH